MRYVIMLLIPYMASCLSAGCAKVSDQEFDLTLLAGICMAFNCHVSTQLKIYPPASGAHLEHLGLASGGISLPCTTCHNGYYNNPQHRNGLVNGFNWVYNAQTPGIIVFFDAARFPSAAWDDAANSCSGLPGSTCHDNRVWATCRSCHVKPPLNRYPPSSGAHAVHRYRGSTCLTCHRGYSGQPTHNDGTVNGYVWQTGTSVPGSVVIFNEAAAGASASFSHASGDCSGLGCHGGKNWYRYTDGCTVCHQYPPLGQALPTSGRHGMREHARLSCAACHNNYAAGNPLHNNGDINGSALDPKATLFGSIVSFSSGGSYNTATGSCSGLGGSCHGTENWYTGGGGD